jgi:negative regulator of sigma E activity
MQITNRIYIGSTLSVQNKEVTVYSVFTDLKKRIFRVETKDKERYQFILFNDNKVSKLFKLN